MKSRNGWKPNFMFFRNVDNPGPDSRLSIPRRTQSLTAIRTLKFTQFCELFFPPLKRKNIVIYARCKCRWPRRLLSCGKWRRVVWQIFAEVSEKLVAFIFRCISTCHTLCDIKWRNLNSSSLRLLNIIYIFNVWSWNTKMIIVQQINSGILLWRE
jgi:hypothetical protein